MVHGGNLKGALEICSFHTRDPSVKYSSHTSRGKACVFSLISNKKKRGSLTPRCCENYTGIVERLSGRRALVKTAASPAAKTWLNPKSRSYALQGGSGSIGQGAHRHSYTQFTQPAFL